MNSKLATLFLITFIAFVTFAGCSRMPVDDDIGPPIIHPPPIPEPSVLDKPVKVVWLLNYPPDGGKDAYVVWEDSVIPTLNAPTGVNRVSVYENLDDTGPHRYISFEFDSTIDAEAYMRRPEIVEVFDTATNQLYSPTVHTFIQLNYFAKTDIQIWAIKGIMFVDYPPGGKQAYLDWAMSIAPMLIAPPQLKSMSTYDNYYGESPNRLIEAEFASQEEVAVYEQLENVMAIEAELDNRAGSWVDYIFALRADYISEHSE